MKPLILAGGGLLLLAGAALATRSGLMNLTVFGIFLIAWSSSFAILFLIGFLGLRSDHKPLWRDMKDGAFLSLFYFPFSFAISWSRYLEGDLPGPTLTTTVGILTILSTSAVWLVILRGPAKMQEYSRDYLTVRTSSDQPIRNRNLQPQKAAMIHLVKCIEDQAPETARRIRRHKVRGAQIRRGVKNLEMGRGLDRLAPEIQRRARIEFRLLRFERAIVRPYEDTGAWTTAFFTSSSLFVGLVSMVPPSLLGAFLLFLPFILIPVIYSIRTRVFPPEQSTPDAPNR